MFSLSQIMAMIQGINIRSQFQGDSTVVQKLDNLKIKPQIVDLKPTEGNNGGHLVGSNW